ncbi:MAG: hypothetical protein P8N49_00010 [Opitutales bacterium]|nr:hypothetical protein [Opitutales bacterium]
MFCSTLLGQSSHLLLLSQGDGAVVKDGDATPQKLTKASFLPKDQSISVRPRSGLETLCSGYNFRFGADTRFLILEEGVELSEGSMMMRSRKINNSFKIAGPEAEVRLNGAGCFLVEVETNGGIKIVTILGRLDAVDLKSNEAFEVLPGELIFIMPGGRGFGEKVNINLNSLVDSSYLLSGFPNNASFSSSLKSVALAQSESIGVTYGAEVGDAKSADSFEVIPSESVSEREETSPDLLVPEANGSNSPIKNYFIPSSDPLAELLGRSPKRLVVSTPATPEVVSGSDLSPVKKDIEPRPFPSRLLRK